MENKIAKIVKHAEVSEKAIERYLCDRIKRLGGICLKYSSATMVGYPDRVALLPDGQTIWIELKSKGKKPTKMQKIRHAGMKMLGHKVYVADSKSQVDDILKENGYAI